jgi:beta-lactam-binding protein with PASTA domain
MISPVRTPRKLVQPEEAHHQAPGTSQKTCEPGPPRSPAISDNPLNIPSNCYNLLNQNRFAGEGWNPGCVTIKLVASSGM